MMISQSSRFTISSCFYITGYGIHSNRRVNILCLPGFSGICFFRKNNLFDNFNVSISNIFQTNFRFLIGNGRFFVSTSEHFLSACFALGVTDCNIIIDSDEMPILDGSSYGFVKAFLHAGIYRINLDRKSFSVPFPLFLSFKKRYALALPSEKLKISYTINFANSPLGRESFTYVHSSNLYVKEISRARTFGFLKDFDKLKNNFYAFGANLDNTLVFDENAFINKFINYKNESVRHKILDFLAVLSFLEYDLTADIYLFCSGHTFDYFFILILDYYISFYRMYL